MASSVALFDVKRPASTGSFLGGIKCRTFFITMSFTASVLAETTIAPLPSSVFEYDVDGKKSGIPYSASATLKWKLNGTQYEAAMAAEMLFVFKRKQTSNGFLQDDLIAPRLFRDEGKKGREVRIDAKQRIVLFEGGVTQTLPANIQDRVSLFFALPKLINEAKLKGQTQFSVPVISTTNVATWTMQIGAPEPVATKSGTWTAIPVKRVVGKADTASTIWYGGDKYQIPVRILMREPDGTFIDQRLTKQSRLASSR
jgi:hypothetical protein